LYTKAQFAKLIDYTLIRPTATGDDIVRFCEEAKRLHFATVVVLPFWVALAVKQLEGTDVKVSTTVGFPHGGSTRSTKVYEARNAVSNGAEELDVVINVGALKSGDYELVHKEISDIVSASQLCGITTETGSTLVKVIIETPLLTDAEKRTACEIVRDAGGDFIKTSTGTAPHGATVGDIKLIRSVVGPSMGVKAAGGIRTVSHALDLLDAGTNRIGTSSGILLVQNYDPEELLKAVK